MFKEYYQFHGFRFSLACNVEDLRPDIESLCPAFEAAPGGYATEWELRKVRGEGDAHSYVLHEDGAVVSEALDPRACIENLEWRILLRVLGALGSFLQVHAAGVVIDGKGLILAGPSGSGKSTIALGMLISGCACLSDEILLIEPRTGTLWPYPRSFQARPETLRLFPALMPAGTGRTFVDRSGKHRVDPALVREDWIAPPSTPAWLVFPTYRPDSRDALHPLDETEALSLLLGQTINLLDHQEEGLDLLVRIVRTCRSYRLIMRDAQCASALLLDLARDDYRGDGDEDMKRAVDLHSTAAVSVSAPCSSG